jgi:heme o synthase
MEGDGESYLAVGPPATRCAGFPTAAGSALSPRSGGGYIPGAPSRPVPRCGRAITSGDHGPFGSMLKVERALTTAVMTTGTERAGLAAQTDSRRAFWSQRARDYVTLTKPRIISLLLVTTLAPMVLAAQGWPGWRLVGLTMLGGYLMAGGANAINMYLDRDIDGIMGRTRYRPIPSGRMSPGHGLAFGIMLAVLAATLLALHVNLLSALLALAGLLYYVFVYTRWLKRSSPQNIVIGGAAGAFPPLVGWAAVTGGLSLTALYLFLIVFFWTPPHFWALALVKQKEYRRVGIPMAPNVWGERQTMRQMILYTGILLPLTLVPVTLGELGWVYGVSAVLLGLWFLAGVVRVARAADFTAPAWSLYRSSLLYLALLFGAVMADGLLTPRELPLRLENPHLQVETGVPVPAFGS